MLDLKICQGYYLHVSDDPRCDRAGIARLMYDYTTDLDDGASSLQVQDEHDNAPCRISNQVSFRDSTANSKTISASRRQQMIVNALSQLGKSNYVVNATVAIPVSSVQTNGGGTGSYHYKYAPALVKLDTGSDVDIVSSEFLEERCLDHELLQKTPAPYDEADCFVTIGGEEFQPESKVTLSWYMEGEQKMRRNTFYVVIGAPVDLLLGSRQFATEAARRSVNVALFASTIHKKTQGTVPIAHTY